MLGLYDSTAARIKARCPTILQAEVGMSPEAVAEMLALAPDVSAIVTPLSDTADPVRPASFIVTQRETVRFGVTLALVAPGGFAQFEPAREEVKATLRGWSPAGSATPIQYVGGRTLSYSLEKDGGRWLHLLIFSTTTQQTYEAQA